MNFRTSAMNTHQQVEALKLRFWLLYKVDNADFEALITASYQSPLAIVEFIENFEFQWKKSGLEFRTYLDRLTNKGDRLSEQDIRIDERNKTIADVRNAVFYELRPILPDLGEILPEETSTLSMVSMLVRELIKSNETIQEMERAGAVYSELKEREIRQLKGLDPDIPF